MTTRRAFGSIVMMFVLALPANGQLQKHFSDAAKKVKETDNAFEKRMILNESFQGMSKALNIAQNSPLISKDDRASIDRFKVTLQEKQDELAGRNGYAHVPDEQLNAFSNYVVQDMEQADITISLFALILIIILVALLF